MIDVLSIAGLIAGGATVVYVMSKSGILHLLVDPLSFLLVFGGTLSATMISYPWDVVRQIPLKLAGIFVTGRRLAGGREALVNRMAELAEIYRRQGTQGLERTALAIRDPFILYGVSMLIDGLETPVVRDNLARRIEQEQSEARRVIEVFRTMATLAPIFGLLGTLIGVVVVLKNLSDPGNLGAGMAIAITTTFYGIFAANFLFLPASVKLGDRADEEDLRRRLIAEGVTAVSEGELPVVISRRLSAFVSGGPGR